MAIIDTTLVFSDGQAITGTELSDNVIDLGATGTPHGSSTALVRDIGKGRAIEVECIVTEAFNNLTSLNIAVETDDAEAISSSKVIARSGEIVLATLVVGHRFVFPAVVPEGVDQRYMALRYTVTGAAPTTGKISAHIVAGRQTNA